MTTPGPAGQPDGSVGVGVLEAPAVDTLKSALRGDLLQPGEDGYDQARRVYNAVIDRRPRIIARCVDAADVIGAVNFARDQGLDLSIRGGSHNVVGFAVNDGGLVVDLSRMKGIRVDLARRTVRAEGGATWGDVDHATHPFGYAVPCGIVASTGVGGLTLGGGIGNLTRPFGLSCDNLLSADVVTADGRLITASETEHPDLFWALRGGGGNFGVVTSFEYKLNPVSTVLGGFVAYPLEKAREAMRFYREYMTTAPEEVNPYFAFHKLPPAPFIPEHLHLVNVCMIVLCCVAPMERAEEIVKPIRQFGPPLLDLLSPMPLPALNSMFDPLLPAGLHHYWKTHFIADLPDEAIEVHVEHGAKVPNFQSAMHMYPISGAAHRLGNDATAFAYRHANWAFNAAGMGPAEGYEERRRWVRDYWEALRPYAEAGTYINFLGDEGEDRIRASYGASYDRLAQVKQAYDPTNLFHMNQNIKPKA